MPAETVFARFALANIGFNFSEEHFLELIHNHGVGGGRIEDKFITNR